MVNFHDFDLPDTIAHEDGAHKVLGGVGLDHAVFSHGIVVVVAAINLLWRYATYGYHVLIRALQHVHDSVEGLIAGDVVGVIVHKNLDFMRGELDEVIGLMKHTCDTAIATVRGWEQPSEGEESAQEAPAEKE